MYVLVLVLILLFPLGLALLLLGVRGRRIDDHPICRRCGFDLFGLPAGSERCSECGAEVRRRRAIRIGRRKVDGVEFDVRPTPLVTESDNGSTLTGYEAFAPPDHKASFTTGALHTLGVEAQVEIVEPGNHAGPPLAEVTVLHREILK